MIACCAIDVTRKESTKTKVKDIDNNSTYVIILKQFSIII